jgi:hypothetical protein
MQSESKHPLIAQVRAELDRSEPDWLRIAALAERAAQLAGGTVAAPVGIAAELEPARARAEAMLEEVRPIVAETDGLLGGDNMARVCLDHAQQAYEDALAAQTTEAALDGFRLAQESAGAAHDYAITLRAQAGRKLPGQTAANRLLGMLGRPPTPE